MIDQNAQWPLEFSSGADSIPMRGHYNLAELIHSRATVEEPLSIFISICLRLSVRQIKIV